MTSFRNLLKRVHQDQRGAVSLETILIIGAIALPILIYIIKYAWPEVRGFFNDGLDTMKEEAEDSYQ